MIIDYNLGIQRPKLLKNVENEYFVNIFFHSKEETNWAPSGHPIYSNQGFFCFFCFFVCLFVCSSFSRLHLALIPPAHVKKFFESKIQKSKFIEYKESEQSQESSSSCCFPIPIFTQTLKHNMKSSLSRSFFFFGNDPCF